MKPENGLLGIQMKHVYSGLNHNNLVSDAKMLPRVKLSQQHYFHIK